MKAVIVDCYTDEASGLGVPPYLGTYPRYIFGCLMEQFPDTDVHYLTIDDLRLALKHNGVRPERAKEMKTDITVYNLTKNCDNAIKILHDASLIVVVLGVHVPGKYLIAMPGILSEVIPMLGQFRAKKVLTGPAVFGTQLFGGHVQEHFDKSFFDEIDFNYLGINQYESIAKASVLGAEILHQLGYDVIAEIESGKGCDIGRCSFCLEPVKNRVKYRPMDDILDEMGALYRAGARHFRLGKQTCFYSYLNGNADEIERLLFTIRQQMPDIKTLHIDNVNPNKVVLDKDARITKAVVKYCTSGNIAAFGIESFDAEVVKQNTLNTMPVIAHRAIKTLNEYGAVRGDNGLPKFLPGINIIFGLKGESKETHIQNMVWLKRFYDEGLIVRRINIRQVAIFEGTEMFNVKTKFIKKNKSRYWRWRNEIRQEIDLPMLKRVVPAETIVKDVRMEIYDGNTTFGRQWGTYPLAVGIKQRLPLGNYYDISVKAHMLRSITGEVIDSF